MTAREWYEKLRLDGIELEQRKRRAMELRAALGAQGSALEGTISGGGNRDAMAQVDTVMDYETSLESDIAVHDACLERATDILYGRSGNGGLAKASSTTETDCICGYYLNLMSWAEVAAEMVRPETKWPKQWVQRKAMSGLRHIDRIGAATLADS